MKRHLGGLVCWLGFCLATPALAQFTPISTPTPTYTGGTTEIAILAANGTSVGSVTDGIMTLTLSTNLDAHTVPGGGWSTWGSPPETESATPKVLGTYSVLTTQTITLSSPTTTFGFELEPDTFSAFSISVDFMNGATVLGNVTRSVNGSAGARLFAASSTTPITSVVITVPSGANGFAIARLRYANPTRVTVASAVPTLSEWGLIILSGLMVFATLFSLRRNRR